MTRNSLVCIAMALMTLTARFSASANPENVRTGSIALAKAVVRSAPDFLAKPAFELNYGARVAITERKNDWVKIRAKEKSGWLPKAALEVGTDVFQDVGRGTQTNDSIYDNEIVTAGKGFSPEYENMMKSQNGNWNYQDVDAVEKRVFSEKELFEFARSVRLKSDVLN